MVYWIEGQAGGIPEFCRMCFGWATEVHGLISDCYAERGVPRSVLKRGHRECMEQEMEKYERGWQWISAVWMDKPVRFKIPMGDSNE